MPRTPLKETERRAARFEERFGEGGTELDALEALHPGELRSILVEQISRYYDDGLGDSINDAADDAQATLDAINERVAAAHRKELAVLAGEQKNLQAAVAAFEKLAAQVASKITRDLNKEHVGADDFDWPQPVDGDDDDDPLLDSTRDFIEQTDRFKEHQGKDTERATRQLGSYPCTCVTCGKAFASVRTTTRYCNDPCRKPRDPNRRRHKKISRRGTS